MFVLMVISFIITIAIFNDLSERHQKERMNEKKNEKKKVKRRAVPGILMDFIFVSKKQNKSKKTLQGGERGKAGNGKSEERLIVKDDVSDSAFKGQFHTVCKQLL